MSIEIKKSFDELEYTRQRLFDQLGTLDDDLLSTREKKNKWSINQVLVHLLESELQSCKYIKKKMQSDQDFEDQNFSANVRYWVLKLALWLPIKYKKPHILSEPSSEFSFVEVRQQYGLVREELKELIENFPEELVCKQIFKHPMAGRFSLTQTIGFLRSHFEHHHKQITRITKLLAHN